MTTPKKRSAGAPASRERQVAYGEIKRGVKDLEKSIVAIQKGLRVAERQIEADARARIRALREEARVQLAALKGRHREVARTLGKVSAAAEGSWQQVKQAADAILAETVNSAASVVERLKKALPR
jgi:hypothetical protein